MASKLQIILVAAALLAVIVGVLAFYVLGVLHSLIAVSAGTPTGSINAEASLVGGYLLRYNNAEQLAGYALLKYLAFNATGANITTYVYGSNPVSRIYFVNTTIGAVNYCVRCYAPGALADYLYNDLSASGMIINSSSFNYVSLSKIGTVPNDSIVIIASGLMPTGLMPYPSYGGPGFEGNVSLLTLLGRGDTVVYVGRNFTTTIGVGGDIFVTPQYSLLALENASIIETPLQGNSTTQSSAPNSTMTFALLGGRVFGNATAVASERGTFVALSNYPQSGWNNASALAADISDAVSSRFWLPVLARGSINESITNNTGYLPALTNENFMNYSEVNNRLGSLYGVAVVDFYNGGTHRNVTVPFTPRFNSNGDLYMPPVFGETQSLPVTVSVSGAAGHPSSYHISVYNARGQDFGALDLGFYNQSFNIIHYYSFSIPSGYYIASLRDLNNVTYGQAMFYVSPVNITPVNMSFKNGTFVFSLISNGVPLSNVSYSVNLNGAYASNGTVSGGTAVYRLPRGAVVSYGNKTFTFSMFGAQYAYGYDYQSTGGRIPPIYIEFFIAAVFVVVLNIILKAPTVDDYYIDIPKFPPTKKVKVKTDANAVLNIFDSVNYSFHWRYMPLTADEVKTGISANIRYDNVPIAVTLQNVSAVLNKLVSMGSLSMIGGYYAPVKWTDSSKHDIEYLTIFRRLRDYCVTNAMLFTDLDANQYIDMIITKMGVQAHIVIYSSISGMKDIALNNSHKIYIVFLNEGLKLDFMNSLYNSYGEKAELMKMGIEYSYIMQIDTDNLDQMVV